MQDGNLKIIAIMKRGMMLCVAVAGLVLTGTLMGAAQQERPEPTDDTGLPEKIQGCNKVGTACGSGRVSDAIRPGRYRSRY
jgi:hypothetical protein